MDPETETTPMNHPRSHRHTAPRRAAGFTLIELMITVAIIGILARIALPAYLNYVTRGKLVAMTNTLAGMRTAMEQFYQDNRTYLSVTNNGVTLTSPCSDTTNYVKSYSGYYAITCTPTPTATTYKIVVTANAGSANGASYSVDQSNAQVTVSYPNSWGGNTALPANAGTCWLMRKGDSC